MNKRPLTRVRGAREAGVTWRGGLAHPPRGGCASTCIGLDGGQFCIRLRATCESREYHSVVRCPHAPWFRPIVIARVTAVCLMSCVCVYAVWLWAPDIFTRTTLSVESCAPPRHMSARASRCRAATLVPCTCTPSGRGSARARRRRPTPTPSPTSLAPRSTLVRFRPIPSHTRNCDFCVKHHEL